MRKTTRQWVRQQYAFRCGYCGITEADNGGLLTIFSRAHGGTDASSNLVYCCHVCNENKGYWWNPNAVDRILHPLNDPVAAHLRLQSDATLLALTPTGEFHVSYLKSNRPPLVAYRRAALLREAEQQARQATLVRDMNARLSRLEQALLQSKDE